MLNAGDYQLSVGVNVSVYNCVYLYCMCQSCQGLVNCLWCISSM